LKASNGISNKRTAPKKPSETGDSCSIPTERFILSGPSIVLDPGIHAYRSDLADIALAGQLFAPHYARPVTRACITAALVRSSPSSNGEPLYKMAAGEEFALLDVTGGWAWGYRRKDHKVGYVLAEALS
jgi:dipeptidyl peptidase-like protein